MKTTIVYHRRIEKSKVTETGFSYLHYETIPVYEEEISGDTEMDLFIQFYKLNNKLKYCNGCYFKWNDSKWDAKYNQWLNSNEFKKISFELYYGSGVVD